MIDVDEVSKYQILIGFLIWAITLGRVDIMFADITLACYSYAPRQGQWKTALRVFGYLKQHPKGATRFVFDAPDKLEEEKLNKGWKNSIPM